MKKATPKKVFAIVMCLIMSLSALTVFASADQTPATPTFAKTVYMSSEGADTNDGLTQTTAVSTIQKATEILGENGGEIVVLDDIKQDVSNDGTGTIFVRPSASLKTVYIHGVKKADNSYTSLLFDAKAERSIILDLSSPLAIYDLTFGVVPYEDDDTSKNSSLWISANGYPLTIGNNVTVSTGTKAANICGGRQGSTCLPIRSATEANVVTIYSGVWAQIYGSSFDKNTTQSGGAIINMIGGSADAVHAVRGAKNGEANKSSGDFIINYYGGSLTGNGKTGFKAMGSFNLDGYVRTHALNLYAELDESIKKDAVGEEAAVNNLIGVFAGEGAIEPTVKTGAAPDFWEISNVSYEKKGEITFEEEPDLSGPNKGNTDKNDSTADTDSTDTTAATEAPVAEEQGGCGSAIGAGTLVIMAVVGSAAVIGKKKKQ